jgi:HPt (histidine-containing phosphotransfer) domain-containing protein
VPPEKSDPGPPLIRAEALERVGNDEAFLEELLDLFGEEFESKTKALSEAISRRDATALRELGHSIKGAAANLSLPGLRASAQAMEQAGASLPLRIEDARTALETLRKEFERFRKFRTGR